MPVAGVCRADGEAMSMSTNYQGQIPTLPLITVTMGKSPVCS